MGGWEFEAILSYIERVLFQNKQPPPQLRAMQGGQQLRMLATQLGPELLSQHPQSKLGVSHTPVTPVPCGTEKGGSLGLASSEP